MSNEKIERLLSEIVSCTGFTNIDQHDIDRFRKSADTIDAEMVAGRIDDVRALLEKAFKSLTERNGARPLKQLLFSVRMPQDGALLMEHMNDISDFLDRLEENVFCLWGLSTVERLYEGQLEIIAVAGF